MKAKIITPEEARSLRQQSATYLESLRRIAHVTIKERATFGYDYAELFYRAGDPIETIANELISMNYAVKYDKKSNKLIIHY